MRKASVFAGFFAFIRPPTRPMAMLFQRNNPPLVMMRWLNMRQSINRVSVLARQVVSSARHAFLGPINRKPRREYWRQFVTVYLSATYVTRMWKNFFPRQFACQKSVAIRLWCAYRKCQKTRGTGRDACWRGVKQSRVLAVWFAAGTFA